MPKKICILTWLFFFSFTWTAIAKSDVVSDLPVIKSRQIPIPGPNEPMFPRGSKLQCYIPYRVEIRDTNAGVVDIILVKKLEADLKEEPMSHLFAVGLLSKGRNQLWALWRKFNKDLENNDIRISKEISDSRDFLKEIRKKELWQKEQELLNLINIGQPLNNSEPYPIDFPYSDKTEVVGLAVRYEKKDFRPIYDMNNDEDSHKYWEFVTEYVRKYGIATPDWDHPENDKDIPPIQFFYDEVCYE